MIAAALTLMRPKQWVKNGFVFFGLLFGHAWHVPATVHAALLAFAAFCLMSSAVYALNDLRDVVIRIIVLQFEVQTCTWHIASPQQRMLNHKLCRRASRVLDGANDVWIG